MRKWIIFTILLLTSNCFAGQLYNYEQIKCAIKEGKLIRIFVDYTKCTSRSPLSSQRIMIANHDVVYTPNEMVINDEGDIVSSILYFTMNDGHYPSRPV